MNVNEYVYWISYSIRSSEHGRTFEENSFLTKQNPKYLSLKAIKEYVLEYHGYDPQQHYVRIEKFNNLGPTEASGKGTSISEYQVLGE